MTNLKFVALSAALLSSLAAQALTVGTLRTQYLKSPVGVDCASPSFSWQLTSERRGTMQQTYRVELSTDPSMGAIVYDSGTVSSPQSANVQLEGLSLAPATRYYWRVTVADNHGETATASDMFETGLMDTGWSGAQWIRVSDGSQPVTDPGTPAVTDYTIETDFEVQRVAAGLIWGATDHSNYYMWQINTEKEKPMFRPHSWTNGNPQCLEEKVLPMPLANDEVHHMTIEVTDGGTRANTYIDGTLIDSRLGSFPYGQLGFRSARGCSHFQVVEERTLQLASLLLAVVLAEADLAVGEITCACVHLDIVDEGGGAFAVLGHLDTETVLLVDFQRTDTR